jgi:hypothetical protein
MVMTSHPFSAAFFCPRARRPRDDYVTELRSYLSRRPFGITLLHHVSTLHNIWPLFSKTSSEIRGLVGGQDNLDLLVSWSKGGPVPPVCETTAGLAALPLLLVLQLGQYFRFLEVQTISHEDFLQQVDHVGGIHGFCGGAAAALSIACARDEAEVIANAAVILRIMVGVGAVMDAAGDWDLAAPTTLAVRLKYEGQGEDILKQFPGVSDPIHPIFHTHTLTHCRRTYLLSVNRSQSVSCLLQKRLLALPPTQKVLDCRRTLLI